MKSFLQKSSTQTLVSLIALIFMISSCSRHTSSSSSSSSGGNTGFQVTPPASNDPTSGSGGNGGTASSGDGSVGGGTAPGGGPTPGEGQENVYDFVLNQGASVTHDLNLNLSLTAPVSVQSIKVGQTNNCSDGVVESFKNSLTRQVFQRNAVNIVSVQFISFTGDVGACVMKSILQDDQGPTIVISQYPAASMAEGSNTDIKYNVSDISKVANVTCSLNDISKPCASGDGVVNLTTMTEGSYTFKITAQDEFGYASEKSVSWNVVSTVKQVNQVVDIKDDRKADILIVDDNSASMEYEQQSMARRVKNMLAALKGLDWQIAVTTTDPRNIAKGDGRLLPIYGTNGALFLKSGAQSDDEAQSKLGMTIQRPEIGSPSEQPINATYRFIERALSTDPAYRKFFRDNSNFAVLVISDEDESANEFRNDPTNLINFVSKSFNQQKVFTWNSIITKPGDLKCKQTNGDTYGERLAKFSQMTGGVIGSVCESDYATQMVGIANGIVNMAKSLTLTCQALSSYPIVVKKDGLVYAKPFTQEGINLKFSDVLEPGSYSVDYTCLK